MLLCLSPGDYSRSAVAVADQSCHKLTFVYKPRCLEEVFGNGAEPRHDERVQDSRFAIRLAVFWTATCSWCNYSGSDSAAVDRPRPRQAR